MRILLAGDYPPDPTLGSPKVFYKLQEELRALGHECDVMFADEIGGPASRQVRQLVAPWLAARAINRRLAQTRYDVVDAASAEGLWIGVARKMGRHCGTAIICRSNGLEQLNYRRMLDDARAGLIHKPWTRRIWYPVSRLSQVAAAARSADRLLLLTDADRDYAIERNWQPADRIDVVPHGVSSRFLEDAGARGARGGGLLFCGSWDAIKGIPYLVDAFERLCERGRTERLTILGPGVPEADVLGAFSPRARSCVRVIARVPEEQVIEMYRAHDVLLWTSTYEGFGLVLLEAMSQRLAVVTTAVGCAPGLVHDGQNGVLVPARDSGAVATAVERLLDDAALRTRLGDAARVSVAALTWRATALQTLEVYRRALADGRPRA